MDRIKVLVVDDNIRFRWGLMEALGREEPLEIVEEASGGNEAVKKAIALRPHIVLSDLRMPEGDGIELTRQLQVRLPETRVLLLTVSDSDSDLLNALKAGARGYLLKNEDPAMIAQAIQYVARGGIVISPAMASKLQAETQTTQPNVEAVGGVSSDQGELEAVPAESESAPLELETDQAIPDPTYHEPQMEGSHTAEDQDVPPSDDDAAAAVRYELVLDPPLDPISVLKLHQWLKSDAKAEVEKVSPSLAGSTVMTVTHRATVPLLQGLVGLSVVAEVTEGPYIGDTGSRPADSISTLGQDELPAQEPGTRRLRLTQKRG